MIINLLEKSENTLNFVGTHFRVTESQATIKATFEGGQQAQTVNLERGMAFMPFGGYTRVRLYSDVQQVINIESTQGALDDNRISGRINVVIESLSGIKARRKALDELVTLIAQPDAGRNRLQIKNVGTESAFIGGVNADSQGYEIKPNEELEIKRAGGAEIYAVSNVAGTTIHMFEEFDTAQAVTIQQNLLTTESGAALLTESGDYLTV